MSPLTVTALATVRLDHAQLAYLSACRTANSVADDLLDEAIHLTSAFLLAGYPHVIGTMWPIGDHSAVEVCETFYSALTIGGAVEIGTAADALHHAVRALRDQERYRRLPGVRASHIHAGA